MAEEASHSVRSTCRSCGHGDLQDILSLGEQYLSDFVEEEKGLVAPLDLVICHVETGGCGLVQLRHTVKRDLLYRQYWYKSGVNETMVKHLHEIAASAAYQVGLQPGEKVVDIGCNDGTLLRGYRTEATTIGFEPAANLVEEARQGTEDVVQDYFSYEAWEGRYGGDKARVVTAIAMFYDLEDPNKFVGDVARILAKDGVFIIQQNYLPTMLERDAFDNISHEHLEYYTLMSLEPLLRRHGLEVTSMELNDINGGSLRTGVTHRGRAKPSPSVAVLREHERRMELHRLGTYQAFGRRVMENYLSLKEFIEAEVLAEGRTIYAYGPGNRGNVILQFYHLDSRLIKAAAERNPDKWGRKTAGTWIPIISEERMREDHPDYLFILPWAFADAFEERERAYLESGGKFIVPLPQWHVREA